MNTLIIYDNNGQIFSQITGAYLVPNGGIQYLEIEVPQGKSVSSVDTTVAPHKVILEDIPPTESELLKNKVTQLEAENANINYALMMGGLI
jgi:hypothetical protein